MRSQYLKSPWIWLGVAIVACLAVAAGVLLSRDSTPQGLIANGQPTAALNKSIAAYEDALLHSDKEGLLAMAAPSYGTGRVTEILHSFGGHRVTASHYESEIAGETSMSLTADCGSGRNVEFGVDFRYEKGSWHPVLGYVGVPDGSDSALAAGISPQQPEPSTSADPTCYGK
jgi:hypothetical protein